ncbi:hypothetical protein ACRTDU_17025 [Sunxiuqinia elliptica]
MRRRNFLKDVGMFYLLSMSGVLTSACGAQNSRKIRISNTESLIEKEPLIEPFGFKGGYLSELWQTAVRLRGSDDNQVIGLGTQSVLWSDKSVFLAHSEDEGNALMYAITQRALEIIKGQSFSDPVTLLEQILDEVYAFGKKLTKNPNLRKTFILNALVAVDNALWLLYAKENGLSSFDQMIPEEYRSTFSERHKNVAAIPLVAYGTSAEQLRQTVTDGHFFMKIKLGQPGTQQEMLQKDMERLGSIHEVLKDVRTPHTYNGKLPYYFDANGRYESKETFLRFLEHAQKIGAFDQITIVEEPFPEELQIDVSDIPVRLAADESAHTDVDTIKRIKMGYRAIALKPIAKTLSMTMKIAKAATEQNIPCFCADLTVNPILVEWNKNIAARLKTFPGLNGLGLLESNGAQNYKNWKTMKSYLPISNQRLGDVRDGLFSTGPDFYESSGGIFKLPTHYNDLFGKI